MEHKPRAIYFHERLNGKAFVKATARR